MECKVNKEFNNFGTKIKKNYNKALNSLNNELIKYKNYIYFKSN